MADKKLFSIRIQFIENVTEITLKKLTNDLLADKVLNNQEKDVVLQKVLNYDKASHLIDLVRKKGDKASSRMIAHLKERDQRLYSMLDPITEMPAQPVASSLPEVPDEPASDSLLSNLKNIISIRKDIYPVCPSKTRLALLINNVKFKYLGERKGAEKDQENMEDLLKYLQYTVVKYSDLTAMGIDEKVQNFSELPDLSQADSVFVIIMSHGQLGVICGINDRPSNPDRFPINNIFQHLNTKNCPALLNKPKVIIIQACRGDEDGSVWVRDGSDAQGDPTAGQVCDAKEALSDVEELEDDAIRAHREKDFIAFMSCTQDTVSYRSENTGSLHFKFIKKIFKNHARTDHIEEMFTKVMNLFEDHRSGDIIQMPTKERCTLTKPFYIFGNEK